MKYIGLLLLSLLASCSNPENINPKVLALNGTWSSACLENTQDFNIFGAYVIDVHTFTNGNYYSNLTQYSDINCTEAASETQEETGIVTFVEEVTTESGVTANKVQFEVISTYLNRPPTYETLIYIDSNILYFGAFLDDLNVLFFNSPYMKED